MRTLADVTPAPGVHINTGASGPSSTGVPIPPDMRTDADADDVRFPDARVRDEGESPRVHPHPAAAMAPSP
jgi:hypothetical protein